MAGYRRKALALRALFAEVSEPTQGVVIPVHHRKSMGPNLRVREEDHARKPRTVIKGRHVRQPLDAHLPVCTLFSDQELPLETL